MSRQGPYARAGAGYRGLGWSNPIPVQGKHPPVKGFTGHNGTDVTPEQVRRWSGGQEGAWNIGLRLHDGVIGLDVDAYDDKQGAETVAKAAAELGGLPATWSTTSRGAGQPARIHLFRVPTGLDWSHAERHLGRFGPHVNVVHRGWRYAMVAPSTHPAVQQPYRWYDSQGRTSSKGPRPSDLAELPETWIAALTAPGAPLQEQAADETEEEGWDGPIPVGERRRRLLAYAGRLRARGLTLAEAQVLFRRRWEQCAQPPGDPSPWERAEAMLADVFGRYPDDRDRRPAAAGRVPSTKEEERTSPPVPVVGPRVYDGLLGEIVATAAPSTEADPVGIYATLLAGVGALVGPGPHVQVGNTRHPLLVWPLLFGRTGSGRKGEATETGELFLLLSSSAYADLRVTGLSSGEGLIERIRDADPDDPKDEGGTEDKRLVVIEPEFSIVMARARREGSTLAGVLREAWAGKALGVLNRRALKASSSHVAIVGHVTPREFRLRLAEADVAGGTFNRFLPLWVERSRRLPIPQGIDRDVRGGLARRLGQAVTQASKLRRLQLDQQATDLWVTDLYDELTVSDDDDQAWTEITRRAAPYALRVAAITAALDGRQLIRRADLDAAGALVRYAVATARYVLDDQLRDPRLDRVRRAIATAGPDGLSRTEVSALFSRTLPKTALDALVAELLKTGDYQRFEVRTSGRPAERYRLRPSKEV